MIFSVWEEIKSRVWAKIAGGAQMFTFANTMEIMRIGDRNTDAVVSILKDLNIPLLARDTGGNYGRTVELKLDTGIFSGQNDCKR